MQRKRCTIEDENEFSSWLNAAADLCRHPRLCWLIFLVSLTSFPFRGPQCFVIRSSEKKASVPISTKRPIFPVVTSALVLSNEMHSVPSTNTFRFVPSISSMRLSHSAGPMFAPASKRPSGYSCLRRSNRQSGYAKYWTARLSRGDSGFVFKPFNGRT